jgi:hypothetical protein
MSIKSPTALQSFSLNHWPACYDEDAEVASLSSTGRSTPPLDEEKENKNSQQLSLTAEKTDLIVQSQLDGVNNRPAYNNWITTLQTPNPYEVLTSLGGVDCAARPEIPQGPRLGASPLNTGLDLNDSLPPLLLGSFTLASNNLEALIMPAGPRLDARKLADRASLNFHANNDLDSLLLGPSGFESMSLDQLSDGTTRRPLSPNDAPLFSRNIRQLNVSKGLESDSSSASSSRSITPFTSPIPNGVSVYRDSVYSIQHVESSLNTSNCFNVRDHELISTLSMPVIPETEEEAKKSLANSLQSLQALKPVDPEEISRYVAAGRKAQFEDFSSFSSSASSLKPFTFSAPPMAKIGSVQKRRVFAPTDLQLIQNAARIPLPVESEISKDYELALAAAEVPFSIRSDAAYRAEYVGKIIQTYRDQGITSFPLEVPETDAKHMHRYLFLEKQYLNDPLQQSYNRLLYDTVRELTEETPKYKSAYPLIVEDDKFVFDDEIFFTDQLGGKLIQAKKSPAPLTVDNLLERVEEIFSGREKVFSTIGAKASESFQAVNEFTKLEAMLLPNTSLNYDFVTADVLISKFNDKDILEFSTHGVLETRDQVIADLADEQLSRALEDTVVSLNQIDEKRRTRSLMQRALVKKPVENPKLSRQDKINLAESITESLMKDVFQ